LRKSSAVTRKSCPAMLSRRGDSTSIHAVPAGVSSQMFPRTNSLPPKSSAQTTNALQARSLMNKFSLFFFP
jgi:hypothetical protein